MLPDDVLDLNDLHIDEDEDESIYENYLRQFGAAWDNIEEAALELENGI